MEFVETTICGELESEVIRPPQPISPIQSEYYVGSPGLPDAPRFVFSSTGSAVCCWNSHSLHCLTGCITACGSATSVSDSSSFLWSPFDIPSDALPPDEDYHRHWQIVDAIFVCKPFSETAVSTTPYLAVLLVHEIAARSLLCLFPDLLKPSCGRIISLHGRAVLLGAVWPDTSQPSVEFGGNMGAFSTDVFGGVLSIAFERGLFTLLDLCLDWPKENFCPTFQVEPAVLLSHAHCKQCFELTRRASPFSMALEHSLVNLNETAVSWDKFYYHLPNEKVAVKIPSRSVSVTMLRSVRQIKSLIVGFNFGGWQIWRLTDLKLIFTFQNLTSRCATISCAFSEPSDDPRFVCYLWIGWQAPKKPSHNADNSSSAVSAKQLTPKTSLFQLGFKKRVEHVQPGTRDTVYEYNDLCGAAERLSTSLSALSVHNSLTSGRPLFVSQLKSIQSMSTNYITNFGLRSSKLTAIVWRTTAHIMRIGLFDMDRWYNEQMPAKIWPDNSFFAVYDACIDSNNAFPFASHVLPQTLLAFWVRTYHRECVTSALCSAANESGLKSIQRQRLSGKTVPAQNMRKPLPEVQLRPSVHGFNALVLFVSVLTPEFSDMRGNIASVKFVSRQELCLRELSKACVRAVKQAGDNGGVASCGFDVYQWITEAIACGLILELEDSVGDVARVLDDADEPFYGVKLALGVDHISRKLIDSLNLDAEETAMLIKAKATKVKRRRLISGSQHSPSRARQMTSSFISPAWVLVANCLFEQRMFHELKCLQQLIASTDCHPRLDHIFIQNWVWLRWLGRKSQFDDLCQPVFATGESEQLNAAAEELSAVNFADISISANQLRELASVARDVYVTCPSEKTVNFDSRSQQTKMASRLAMILAYAQYTRPVCLLIRLGLLPQISVSEDDHLSVRSGCHLLRFSFGRFAQFIATFQRANKKASSAVGGSVPFLTDCILKHLLFDKLQQPQEPKESSPLGADSGTEDHVWPIWMDQEGIIESSSNCAHYPPKRLQTVCALWQTHQAPTGARLALLVFLLFDWVAFCSLQKSGGDEDEEKTAVNHEGRRVRYMSEKISKSNYSTSRAIYLHGHVVSQLLKEFPDARTLLPTIQTLWLIDRCRFSEVLHSRLSPIATGRLTSLASLHEIFPNQALRVVEFCLHNEQLEIAALFGDAFTTENPAFFRDFLPANPLASGAPLLALDRVRRIYSRLSKPEATSLFLDCANYFRNSGRLLDFINLSLTTWEAEILFEFLRSRCEFDLLFCCLVARAQYKAASDLISETGAGVLGKLQTPVPVIGLLSQTMLASISSTLPLAHLRTPLELDRRDDTAVCPTCPFAAPSEAAVLAAGFVTNCIQPVVNLTHVRAPFDTEHSGSLEDGGNGSNAAISSTVSTHISRLDRTPRRPCLSLQPTTGDKRQHSEFWKDYKRIYAFDVQPFSPVAQLIPENVRRYHKQIFGLMYTAPMDSARKTFRDISVPLPFSTFNSDAPESFRSSLNLLSEMGSGPRTVTTFSNALNSKPESGQRSSLKSTPAVSKKEADSLNVSLDDGEVTINPQTLKPHNSVCTLLTEPVTTVSPSCAAGNTPDTELASTPVLSSSKRLMQRLDEVSSQGLAPKFIFSPPVPSNRRHQTIGKEIGEALCCGHFTFSSPTSFAKNYFTEVPDEEEVDRTVLEIDQFVNSTDINCESFSEHGNLSPSNSAKGCTDRDELEKETGNAFVYETQFFDETFFSTATEPIDGEVFEAAGIDPNLITPRRSRRHVKQPERYQAV